MGALFNYAAFVYHQYAVRLEYGGKAVGNYYAGTALHEGLHGGLDGAFADGIQCAGCFIQYEDAGIFQHYPRKADALLFAAGQLEAAVAYHGVVAFGEGHYHVVNVGYFAGADYFLLGGLIPGKAQIVRNGAVEKVCFLGYHAYLAPEEGKLDIPYVCVANADAAIIHIVQAGDKVYYGGFSGAGRANYGVHLAAGHGKGKV